MADQPFTLENHIEGPVYMETPTASAGAARFEPSEHDQLAPSAPSTAGSHGFLGGIGPLMSQTLQHVDFATMAKHAAESGLAPVMHVLDSFGVSVTDAVPPTGEAVQNGVEAGMDAILVIPDDGYDYVDGELVVAEADDDAHEAQAVAGHDASGEAHDADVAVHDSSYDA